PMLRGRADLLKQFEESHFESLQGKHGVAFDIGYLGYFSRADICDAAGLVNGREKARLTTEQRFAGCLATHPDFIFVNPGGIGWAGTYFPIKDWQICSRYNFTTVSRNDPHYL